MKILEDIKNLIKSNLENSEVFVRDMTGTLNHLEIFVGWDEFKGQTLLEQHQLIMDILKGEFENTLHAVKLKTMNLNKYKELFNN